MNNTVEMFIYHDINNKMLIVNHERKEFKIVDDYDLINIFRTTMNVRYIQSVEFTDIVYFITKLLSKDYKDMSTLVS